MEFDGLFGFINNEEDFIKLVALYKIWGIEDNKIKIDRYNITSNFYGESCTINKCEKKELEDFVHKLNNDNFIKYIDKGKSTIINGNYCKTLKGEYIISINEEELKNYIKLYEDKLINKVMSTNYLKRKFSVINNGIGIKNIRMHIEDYRLQTKKEAIKECYIPIDKEIENFIEDDNCLCVYLFFKYLTFRLYEDKESFSISKLHLSSTLQMCQSKVSEYIKVLVNNNLLEQIKIISGNSFYYKYRPIQYEEFKVLNNGNEFIYNTDKQGDNNVIKESPKRKTERNDPQIYYTVYEITDLTNNMKYIGKHKTKNIDDGYMGSGRLLKENQNIKGMENFTKKILHLCKNEEHMAEMEKLEIDKAKAYDNNMYYNLKKE